MATHVDPLDLADIALRVDSLVAAASEAAVKFVTLSVENLSLAHEEGLCEVPAARLAVLSNLGPDLVGLVLARLGNVLVALELLAILGSDGGGKDRSDESLKHSLV